MPHTVHTYPLDDVIEHATTGDDCLCGPDCEAVFDADGVCSWLIVHHSLDGRERFE